MNRHFRSRSLFAAACAALAATTALTAQDRPGRGDVRTPIHTAEADQGLPYGLWGGGDAYKASFHGDPTFVPYLGRDYPVTQSLQWHTVSARIGEAEFATASPRRSWTDYRAEFDHGAMVEAYDLRREGLEQTFVFGTRPTTAGDLVVRGAITTGLSGAIHAGTHDELVFVDQAGRAIVGYGAATAIDANGTRLPMQTSYEQGEVTLRLAASAVAAAAFPLVVDPLVGNLYSVGGATLQEFEVMRDTTLNSGNIWHATMRWVSGLDSDIWLRRIDDDGLGDTLVFTDISTSWSAMEPSLGLSHSAGTIVLAFTRDFPNTNKRYLRCHTHGRADFVLSTAYFAIGTSTYNAWRPDVATDLHPLAPQSLLVVFQREDNGSFANTPTSAVYGSLIDVQAGSAGPMFAIAESAFDDIERPDVGKLQVGSPLWTVAYQIIADNPAFSSHSDWDVELRRVDRAATVSSASHITGVGTGSHEMAPRLAGYNETQALAFVRSDPAVVGGRPNGEAGQDLVVRTLQWLTNTYTWTHNRILTSNLDPRVVTIGFDIDRDTMSHYLVAYRSTVTENIYAAMLGYDDGVIVHPTVHNPAAGLSTVGGAVAYDDDHERFLIGYGLNGNSNDTRIEVFEQPSAPAPTLSGLGCSNVAPQWQGSQLIGSSRSSIRMTGLPNGALATILVGTQPHASLLAGVPLVHPGCWLLVPNTGAGSLGTMPFGIGPDISYPLALPSWLGSMSLYFQGVHFDATSTEVFTTQRLQVPIVR